MRIGPVLEMETAVAPCAAGDVSIREILLDSPHNDRVRRLAARLAKLEL